MPATPHCARPGCGGAGAAWLTYDYGARTVWLDSPETDAAGTRLALCPAHADRLRVPVGWTCRDRRRGTRTGAAGVDGTRSEAGVGGTGTTAADGPESGSARSALAL